MTRADVLLDAPALAGYLADGVPTRLLDVRWALGRSDAREEYARGHLPGAVFVDLDAELAAAPSPAAGRHPLPSVAELQASARRWGVTDGDLVVAYDASGGTAAARAWWLLRWAGLSRVLLLDGGLAAWTAAGLPLVEGDVVPAPGDVVLPGAAALATVDADGAAGLAREGVLLDARAAERYRGEVEPVDPRAGHIPGAVSSPTGNLLTASGTFREEPELRRHFAALGVDGTRPTGVYCGSGVTAAHTVAALASLGVEAALYPGSWSQWSADPARPAATER